MSKINNKKDEQNGIQVLLMMMFLCHATNQTQGCMSCKGLKKISLRFVNSVVWKIYSSILVDVELFNYHLFQQVTQDWLPFVIFTSRVK